MKKKIAKRNEAEETHVASIFPSGPNGRNFWSLTLVLAWGWTYRYALDGGRRVQSQCLQLDPRSTVCARQTGE